MPKSRAQKSDSHFKGPLADSIGRWAGSILGPYLRRFPENPVKDAKQIHDPIRKMVVVDRWEVFILDSPLMQRLRYIRQLGVGHYLFPSSGYSRFEHSIGAMATASALFDSITNERSKPQIPYDQKRIDEQRRTVRLAALLHDVGHCVFSHVSEKFYGQMPEVQDAVAFFNDWYQREITPSEAVSIVILQSGAFRRLLKASRMHLGDLSEDEIADIACACIAGSKHRTYPDCYLSELVNSSVDCDKLDYLARDSRMAGVPVSLDIERLLSKIRLVKVEDEDEDDDDYYEQKVLRRIVGRRKAETPSFSYSLAILPSAARAVEELLVSRIFLYDKFYFHPKVMAAEELVRRALEHLAVSIPRLRDPGVLLSFGDDQLINLCPEGLATLFKIKRTDPNIAAGCELLDRAKNRYLPKRVFAFAERFLPKMPEVLAYIESKGRTGIVTDGVNQYRMLSKFLDSARRTTLLDSIAVYAKQLGASGEVFLAHQSARRATGNINIPVILADGSIAKKDRANFLFEASTWTEAYAANKATSYVYAYDENPLERARVHLAAERTFTESGLTFAPNCVYNAKLSESEVDRVRRDLPAKWFAYRTPPDSIDRRPSRRRLEQLAEKFDTHLKQVDDEIAPMLVEAWVWQFRRPYLREGAIALLEHVKYIEAPKLRAAFSGFVSQNSKLREAVWAPLRRNDAPGKSADQLRVYLKNNTDVKTVASSAMLKPSLLEATRRIVFFDDSLNSGVQVSALLASWFDRQPLIHNQEDADAEPLASEIRATLRKCEINFAYYSAHPMGIERLTSVCKKIGLEFGRIYSKVDSSDASYRVSGMKGTDRRTTKRFVDFLKDVGTRLLIEKGMTPRKAARFALGYSGIDLALVYPHSISASTPAAMWQFSENSVEPWLPLFPRKRPERVLKAVRGEA